MMATTKIGMIIEGTLGGPDQQVLEYAVSRLAPVVDVESRPMGDKRNLMGECGSVASMLLNATGCDHVIILWDLSSWGQKPCRKSDVENIHTSLAKENVPMCKIHLICVEHELESWLLSDARALKAALSRPTYPGRQIPNTQHPDREPNPKKKLKKIFREHGAPRGYREDRDPLRIAKKIENCREMEKSPSFKRFARIIQSFSSRPEETKKKK